MLRVLMICGAGASTGFMAQAARRAAKKKHLDISIEAKSTAHLEAYIDFIDVLLLGSHFSYKQDEIKAEIAGKDIVFGVIPQEIFGRLDGDSLIEYIQEICAANNRTV